MLSLHTKRKHTLLAVASLAVILPTISLVAGNILSSNDSSAIDYPMPAGFVDQNFANCVTEEFKTKFPNEEIPSTGLTDEQLGRITSLGCLGSNKPDSEKIADTSGLEKMTALTKIGRAHV